MVAIAAKAIAAISNDSTVSFIAAERIEYCRQRLAIIAGYRHVILTATVVGTPRLMWTVFQTFLTTRALDIIQPNQ